MEGNLKRVMTLVRRRRSVRTFDGNPLREEDAAKILEFARREKNPYGIPIDWQMLSADKDGLTTSVIIGADTFFTGKMHPVEHAEEAFGYALERIVLYAQSMGIGSTWIAGTMDRPAFERAIGLAEDEVMPCVTPLGYPAEKMSLREGMMRKGVKADSRLSFDQLFFEGSFDSPLQYGAAGDFSDLLEIVRWAPSAVNKQPCRLQPFADLFRAFDDFFFPLVVLCIQLVNIEAVLPAHGAYNRFVINMKGYPVMAGHFLRQRFRMSLLYFVQMAGAVDDSVEADSVTSEQASYIALRPEGGGIDPHLVAHLLQGADQFRRAPAQSFFIKIAQGKGQRRLCQMCSGIYEQDLVQIKGDPHLRLFAFHFSQSSL